MDKEIYYKWLFKVGGVFNWLMAVSFLVGSLAVADIFALFGTTDPPTLFFLHALLGLIFVYGIGYYMVGQDITKNRGIVWLGVLSKLSFFSFCVTYFLLGDLSFIIVVFGSFDFFFACLFLEYIVNYERL
ncbi:hypothetical protein EU538_11985 [Candidatus Thorarchaeota archaeon]|nr:MAG: hypothetical protein EU538_11985 [Candidatus Thorarchaeota archaeon]